MTIPFLSKIIRMKLSLYNIIIPYKKYLLLYNTLWSSVVMCFSSDMSKWGIDDKLHLSLSNIDHRLISTLKENKIILDDDIDERNMVKNILEETNNVNDVLEFTIIPSLACNFSCWYCYENHDTKDHISQPEIKHIVLALEKITINKPEITTIKISFFGGEPLLYFKIVVIPLIENLKKDPVLNALTIKVGFTTNGYLISNKFIKYFTENPILEAIQVTLDGNKERHNKVRFSCKGDNSYSRITKNIIDCLKHKINIVLRLNISEDTKLDIAKLLKEFTNIEEAKQYLHISIQKVWQSDYSVYNTIDRLLAESRSLGFDSASYFTYPSSIWSTCYADKPNSMVINPNGKVFKCTARDFSPAQEEGHITEYGDIQWNDIHEKRMHLSPLNNKECIKCNIFPICAGGCSQKVLEDKIGKHCNLMKNEKLRIDYARRVLFEEIEQEKIERKR